MANVSTMAAVHQHVHQRTRHQDEPRERRKNVRAVFGEEKE
jgi:hypothetical protein